MMKSTIGAISALSLLCALGCGSRYISTEGKTVHLVKCDPKQHATAADFQDAEKAIRAIPSKAPTMERFEWGRVRGDGDLPERYYLLVLFDKPQSASDPAYLKAEREVMNYDERTGRAFTTGTAGTYLFHDATPHVRTTTHGHLRHMVRVTVPTTSRELMREFENAIVALPNTVSSIERLEWGTTMKYDRDGNFQGYCVLFTFANTEARDRCLAHPAYKEFRSFWEEHHKSKPYGGISPKSDAQDFLSHVEYMAPQT
jgi:hypothetical protein